MTEDQLEELAKIAFFTVHYNSPTTWENNHSWERVPNNIKNKWRRCVSIIYSTIKDIETVQEIKRDAQ